MAATPLVSLVPPAEAGVNPVTGDWTVCGPVVEEYWGTPADPMIFEVDGDLIVGSAGTCGGTAGTLIIHYGGIRMVQDASNVHTVNVQAGGTLQLYDSFLTTTTKQVDPYVMLDVTVSGAFTLDGGWMRFPGSFTQAGGEVWIEDAIVGALDSLPANVNADSNNDGPSFTIGAGSAVFVRSRIEDMWQTNTALPAGPEEFVISGSGQVTMVDTFVAVDFTQDVTPGTITHNFIRLTGGSSDLFAYNLTVDDIGTRDQPAILTEATSQANILRFMDALVLDQNGVPVPLATLSTEWARTSQTANYPDSLGTAPTPEIQGILGRPPPGPPTWTQTGVDGRARIPLWTDRLFTGTMPNGLAIGDFNVTATSGAFSLQKSLSFPAYPDLAVSDNIIPVTFTLSGLALPQPDLLVQSITFNPAVALEGTDVTATVTVRNAQSGGASNVRVDTTDNLLSLDSRVIPFLAAFGTTSYSLTLSAITPGQHNLCSTVDPVDSVRELNEGNNQLCQGLTVTPLGPDLAITVSAGPAYSGSPVALTAVVSNLGHRPTSSSVAVNFYRDSIQNLIGSSVLQVIMNGTSDSVTISWAPPFDGTFTVIGIVDPTNTIPEPPPYSEANNQASTIVTTVQVPNLRLEVNDLTLTDPFPTGGQSVFLQATVRNVGQVAAPQSTLRFMRDGLFVEDVTTNALAPGASQAVTTTGAVNVGACGLRSITAIADFFDVVAEGSAQETDNTITRNVQVFPGGGQNVTTYSGGGYPPVTSDIQTTKSWDITGSVTIRDASVTFVQGEDLCDKHFIKVRGGTLILENATILSNARFVISVEGAGQLLVRDSWIQLDGADGAGELHVAGNAVLTLEDSTLDGDLLAISSGEAVVTAKRTTFDGASVHLDTDTTTRLWDPVFGPGLTTLSLLSDDGPGASVDFDIRNVTFNDLLTSQLRFRGDQSVQFTSVGFTKPGNWWEGMLEERSRASRYWWLSLRAVDGTSTLVANAEFTLRRWDEASLTFVTIAPFGVDDLYHEAPAATAFPVTSPEGFVDFRALEEDRYANAPHWSYATYFAEGRVDLNGFHYPDANLSALVTADTEIELVFSELTPDFIIESFAFSGMNGAGSSQPVNTEVFITVQVANRGNIDQNGVTLYVYDIDIDTNNNKIVDPIGFDFPIITATLSLPRLGNVTTVLRWTPLTVGQPKISLMVDRYSAIPETNELNNINVTSPIDIFAWPDLSIASSDISAITPVEDNPGIVRVTVRNVGTGPTRGGTVTLSDGVAPNDTRSFGAIDVGKSVIVDVAWTPQVNTTVRLNVTIVPSPSPCNVPVECDYRTLNNSAETDATPVDRPDLRIFASDYVPPDFDTSFVSGRAQDWRVIVWNIGETPATNFLVALYLDGSLNPLASALVAEVPGRTDPLSPGSFTHVFTGITIESVGTHVIRVKADADDRVTELNDAPSNNEANITVTVSLPRVSVTMVTPVDQSRINPGTSVPVNGRVNVAGQIGQIVANASITVRLQDASGAVQGSPVLERTDPDGNYFASLSVPAGLPVGTYTIVANVTTGVGVDSASVTVLVVNPPSTGFVLPGLAFIGVTVLIVGAVLASVLVWSISRRPRGSPPGPHP